jgi:PAS domain S-box-containing protein
MTPSSGQNHIISKQIIKSKPLQKAIQILLVFDDEKAIANLRKALKKINFYYTEIIVRSKKEFIKAIKSEPDIIVAAEAVADLPVLKAIGILKKNRKTIPLIVAGDAPVEKIVEIIKAGAIDYVSSPQFKNLNKVIFKAIEKSRLDKEQQHYIEKLQESETRFRALIENTVDAIVIINTEGMVTYASPTITRVLGYSEEEAVRVSIYDVVHPDDQPRILEMIPECLEKPGISLPVMQYRCKHKNGDWIWVEGSITNMLHEPAINGIVDNFHDITLKKEAEVALKRSEEKYRTFFENSLDAILLTVTDGRVLAANPAACKMFQMTEQEICNAGRKGLVVTEGKAFEKIIEERRKKGKVKGELTFRRKDGTVFLGEISSAIFHHTAGTDRTSMIIRDVSERVQAEKELKESEERYKFLFEYSPTPKWVFELETGKIIDVNDTAIQHYGYSREEFLKMVTNDLKSPEELPRMAEIHKHIAEIEGLNRFGIFTQIKKDGTKIKAEVSGHKCLYNGKACMVIDSFDVTERESILHELKDHKEKLRSAQSIAKLGYWKYDLQTLEVYWSDTLFEIAGLTRENFKPSLENFIKIVHPEDKNLYIKFREDVFNGLEEKEIEYRVIAADGSIKWIHQNGHLIKDENNNPIIFESIAQDVTARKLLELSLEESTLRYQMVSKATSDVIWDWNFEKNKAFWGKGFETRFGYKLDELNNEEEFWENNIHPDDKEWVLNSINQAINSTQTNWILEYRFRKADNSYAYVLDKGFFIRDTKGKAIKLAGGMQDITERKELEHLLDKSNKLARIGSYELNYETGVLYWNSIAKAIYEVPEDFSPTLERITDFYPPELSNETTIKAYNDALEKGIPFDVEVKIRTGKGNIRWVRLIGETEITNGKITKLYGSIQDIDDRKKNEEALQLSIERYNIVARATNDSIWDWDLIENHVVRPGKFLEAALGYEFIPPQQVDDFWQKHVHPEDWKRICDNRQALFDNPSEYYWEDEYRFLKPDGTYALVYDRGYVSRDKEGKAIRMIGASRDITKLKENEIQLKALNEKLEKRAKELVVSNQELEQFAYVASHDLQEPLRMVTSFLNQIEKKYNDLLDEKGKKYVFFAVDGAKRMRQMILDLLEFSRAGKIESNDDKADLNAVVKEILELHQQKIKETHAEISIDHLPVIAAPKIALRQVFQNLISNSLKYSRLNNGIRPKISVTATDYSDYWQFNVSDNGIGIESQYFDKIFVIFQRLHDRSEYSGTGIGLAITKKIIENLGGKIWVESEMDKGSSFFFTVPKKNNNF